MMLAGKRILAVDDSEVNVRLLKDVLSLEGAEVLTAMSAEEALRVAKIEEPDLILMDLQMPDVDGLTATRQLKSDPQTSRIPVVAVTSSAMKDDEVHALESGCSAFIPKPFDVSQLPQQLSAILNQPRPG